MIALSVSPAILRKYHIAFFSEKNKFVNYFSFHWISEIYIVLATVPSTKHSPVNVCSGSIYSFLLFDMFKPYCLPKLLIVLKLTLMKVYFFAHWMIKCLQIKMKLATQPHIPWSIANVHCTAATITFTFKASTGGLKPHWGIGKLERLRTSSLVSPITCEYLW